MSLLFSLRRNSSTIRFRLMVTLGLILLVCQIISVLWLWHESKEQIQLMVEALLRNRNNHRHIEKEIHEAVASLAIPSLVMISLALLLCFQAVKWITQPLYALQSHLENRTEDDLEPIALRSSVREIDAVIIELNRLVARLTNSLERERMFTADVAHELRTPLAGLRLHLELIERKHHVNVEPLISRLDQMTNSVSQLLQLARVGHAFTAGNYQNVSLINDVILPTEYDLKTLLSERHQQLNLVLAADVIIRGDATLLKLLLRNLIENAHRYSPENTAITLRLEDADGPVLAVEDEGPGIDESKSGELTKAFVRMDSRYGGIGLGLSIVTRIAQLHKCQFFLTNLHPKRGCRAWVKLNVPD